MIIKYLEAFLIGGFSCLSLLLSYPPLNMPTNTPILLTGLQEMSGSTKRTLSQLNQQLFTDMLKNFSGHKIHIECETALVDVLQILAQTANTQQLNLKLSQLTSRVLENYNHPKVRFLYSRHTV